MKYNIPPLPAMVPTHRCMKAPTVTTGGIVTVTDFDGGRYFISSSEGGAWNGLFIYDIDKLPKNQIYSSGYVLHTLEASVWCLLTTDNYTDAVLKAVNLGEDTDTTGAVTGGLAGLLYGAENIPESWLKQIAKYDDIENLAARLGKALAT